MTFRRSFTVGSVVLCLFGAACSSTVTEYHDSRDSNSSAGASAAGAPKSDRTAVNGSGGVGVDASVMLAGRGGDAEVSANDGGATPTSTINSASGGSGVGGAITNKPSTTQSGGYGTTDDSHVGGTVEKTSHVSSSAGGDSHVDSSVGGDSHVGSSVGGRSAGGSSTHSTAAGMSNAAGRSATTGGAATTGGHNSNGGASTSGGHINTGGTSGSAVAGNPGVAGAATNCDPLKPFGALKQIVPSTVSSSENSMTVSSDGLSTILAVRSDINNAATSFDLKRYTRATINDVFGYPVNILGALNINTTNAEHQARLSKDRLNLYFTRTDSTRSQIYLASRGNESEDFPVATALDALVNLSDDVGYAFKSLNTDYFYWAVDAKLRRATVTDGAYADLLIPERLNSIGDVAAPALTDDELTIYLASKGSGVSAYSYQQIWRATRTDSESFWNAPLAVTELLDNTTEVLPADVSPDGCILYVTKKVNSVNHLYQATKSR